MLNLVKGLICVLGGEKISKKILVLFVLILNLLVSCSSLEENSDRKDIQKNISNELGTQIPVPELKGYSISSAYFTGKQKPYKMATWWYSKIKGEKKRAEISGRPNISESIYGPFKGDKVASVEVITSYQKSVFKDKAFKKDEIKGHTIYTREVNSTYKKHIISIPMKKVLITIAFFSNEGTNFNNEDFYEFTSKIINQYEALNN